MLLLALELLKMAFSKRRETVFIRKNPSEFSDVKNENSKEDKIFKPTVISPQAKESCESVVEAFGDSFTTNEGFNRFVVVEGIKKANDKEKSERHSLKTVSY